MKSIIQDNSEFIPAYKSLAELQMRQGKTITAIETLQHAITVNPEDTMLLNNLGMYWVIRRYYETVL